MATYLGSAEMLRRPNAQRKLTDKQAREIRLSLDCSKALSQRFAVSDNVIKKIRLGVTYGPLQPDERAADEQRNLVQANASPYVGLSIGRIFGGGMITDQSPLEMKDAAHECAHGRLPHDRTPACGCWPLEGAKTNPTPPRSTHAGTNHRDRLERFSQQAADAPATVDDHGRPADDRPVHA